LLEAALDDERFAGPVNAVAPEQIRHGDFMQAAARAAGGAALAAIPAALLRAIAGEMSALFLDSQRVVARGAGALGFSFRYPSIEMAANALCGRPHEVSLDGGDARTYPPASA